MHSCYRGQGVCIRGEKDQTGMLPAISRVLMGEKPGWICFACGIPTALTPCICIHARSAFATSGLGSACPWGAPRLCLCQAARGGLGFDVRTGLLLNQQQHWSGPAASGSFEWDKDKRGQPCPAPVPAGCWNQAVEG